MALDLPVEREMIGPLFPRPSFAVSLNADKRFPPLKKRESHMQKTQRFCALIKHMALAGREHTSAELEAYMELRKRVLGF